MLNKTNVRRTLVIGLGSLQFDEDATKTVSMLKAATKDNKFIKCTLDYIDEEELFGDIIENIMDNLVDGEQATVESEIFTTVCEYNALMQNRSKRAKALNNNKSNDKDDDEPKVAPKQTVVNNQPKKAEPKTEAPKATEQPKVEESKPAEPEVENNNDLDPLEQLEKAIMNTQVEMSYLDKKTEALIKDFRDGKTSEENTVKAIEGLLLSDKTTITMIQKLLKNVEIPKQLIDDIIGKDGKDLSQVKELLRSENQNLTDDQIDVIESMYLDELNHANKVARRLNKKHVDQRLFAILKTLMKIGVDELKNEISQIAISKNNDSFHNTLNQIHDVMGDVTISPLIYPDQENEVQPENNMDEKIRQWNETHAESKPMFNNNNNQQTEAQSTVTQ